MKAIRTDYGPALQRGEKTACIVKLQGEIDRLGGVPYGWMKIYEPLLFGFYNPRTGPAAAELAATGKTIRQFSETMESRTQTEQVLIRRVREKDAAIAQMRGAVRSIEAFLRTPIAFLLNYIGPNTGKVQLIGERTSEVLQIRDYLLAMPKSILDTDILSEYLKGHDKTVAGHATRYREEHGGFTLTSVTLHEIVYGLEIKSALSQLTKAIAWLYQNEEITPTPADYMTAARVKAAARKSGNAVELPDCLIALIAARTGRCLITGNTEAFSVIQRTGLNLSLENWRKYNG